MSAGVVEKKIMSSNLCYDNMTPQRIPGSATKARRIRRKKATAADVDGVVCSKKRKLSSEQVKFLEMSFGEERKLESGRKVHLAAELGLEPQQVAVWFQNRRARHKGKQVEEAYFNLKSLHDATLLQKCHLETEVLKLKEMLNGAKEEIRKLSSMGINDRTSEHKDVKISSSDSSSALSFSTVTYQPLLVELGLEAEALQAELMYYIHEVDDYCNINYYMEWPNIN